jgi:hypothetical protein
MKRTHIAVFQILLCSLLSAACNHIGPKFSYPPPPATSYRVESVSLKLDVGVQEISAAFVKPEFIQAVHVQPLLGRNFLEQEFLPKPHDVALLSYRLWRQRYRSDPQMVGMTVVLNSRPYTVVGIMPEAFKHPEQAEIWLLDPRK